MSTADQRIVNSHNWQTASLERMIVYLNGGNDQRTLTLSRAMKRTTKD
jgi:hypothetical protein